MSRTGSRARSGGKGLELEPGELRRRLDPSTLPFATTEDVEPLVGTIGQPRALAAIEFGLEVGDARLQPLRRREFPARVG